MENANFEDCCGLTDSTTHAMSARDIALMTKELITKYPRDIQLFDHLDGKHHPRDEAGDKKNSDSPIRISC